MSDKQDNIYLVGPMAAGKTSVGRQLAKLTGKPFYDSDQEIEKRTGVSVSWIFEVEGESGFRQRERDIIEELTQLSGIILATGGGGVVDAINRTRLVEHGVVVYLYVPLDQQFARTLRKQGSRPMIAGDGSREKLARLNEVREPLYRQIARFSYDTGQGDPLQLAERILADIRK